MKLIKQFTYTILVIAILTITAAVQNGQIFGKNIKETKQTAISNNIISTNKNGVLIINTLSLAKNINGYGGKVPLNIYIKEGKIIKIIALKNNETPEFFNEAKKILHSWDNKPIKEAINLKIDAVSGATFSSKAIIANVHSGFKYIIKSKQNYTINNYSIIETFPLNIKNIIGLITVIIAAIFPLIVKNKYYKLAQNILNVFILGFYCNAFLSWGILINFVSSDIKKWITIPIIIIMIVIALVYPLIGHKQYYCKNVCPCGSLQDICSKINKKNKWKISKRNNLYLKVLQRAIFIIVLIVSTTGIFLDWMNYEIFSAFIISTASIIVMILAIITIILSLFIQRPYCRFICPTGALLKLLEGKK